MKKLIIIGLIFLGIGQSKVNAQTAIQILSMTDSMGVHCVTPAISGVNLDAYAIGYPNNTLFTIFIDFGDGTNGTYNCNSWGTTIQNINLYPLHTYNFPGNYTVTAIVTGPDANADTLINVDQAIVSNTCELINGNVFYDADASCNNTSGDQNFQYIKVALYSGTTLLDIFYTDGFGNFSLNAPSGNNYTINVDESYWITPRGFVGSCSNVGSVSFNLTGPVSFEFPYECSIVGFDLKAHHIPGYGFVPGLIGYIHPYFLNNSCQLQSGYVDVTLDPMVSFVTNTGTPPNSINGNILTWNFNAFNNINGYGSLNGLIGEIIFETFTTANIGDLLCFQTDIYPISGDSNPANNDNSKCYPVVASFDPNLKEVSPSGIGVEGFIDPNLTMTYTVQFQNTGTAAAQNVFILDTLDADLDLNTLQIINSSHEMNLYATTNGILKFDFPNIQLPDSNTNEMESHGYVIYQIAQKPNLQPGTEIKNTAHIFFDYNDAVVTNTTLNTIAFPDGILEIVDLELKVFPSPSSGIIELENSFGNLDKYNVYDITGKKVKSGKLESTTLNLESLQNGFYILEICDEVHIYKAKIEIMH